MNKYASYVAFFVMGFVICALAFYLALGGRGGATLTSVSSPHPGMKVVGSNEVATAAEVVSKYVVSIDTIGRPVSTFSFPFGAQEVVPKGKGSGVIISPNGYIVTNNHVVAGAANLTVTLNDGNTQYQAKLIGRDPKTDIAVIKIGASGLPSAKFGDSDSLRVGDWVIAVGNALGLGPTVTAGIISATKRGPIRVENELLEDALQTDAAINRGNSGGAMADMNGDLVGINTAIASSGPDGGNIGIGFAVPSSTVKKVADELINTGKVLRPWLGISYGPYNAEVRKALEKQGVRDLPTEDGAMIGEVIQDSPAARARLQPYDIILRINGKSISGTGKPTQGKTTIAAEVGGSKIGQRLTLEVWHAGNRRTSTIGARVGEMPADLMDRRPSQPRSQPELPLPFGPENP